MANVVMWLSCRAVGNGGAGGQILTEGQILIEGQILTGIEVK